MAEDSVIRVAPSTSSGMVPSGFCAKYSGARTLGGKGSSFSS